ncbi:hypothetical protein GZH52_02545 [Crenobacter sp. HX-7-9]|uniref:Uncharacterized protein n=1 Tax=Crenobacter caeni TaxID=2705474 RepID=A0A6B2KPE9_9NEIS|nr:hypothetical protein [Crenobacter caeni]
MLGSDWFFLAAGFADLEQLNETLFDVAAWWQIDPYVLAGRSLDHLIEMRDQALRINKIRLEAADG